jgi:hypothetical protein
MDESKATKVYKNIRLDEPWNSRYNRAATANTTVEQLFHCPTANSTVGEMNYVMVVGADTISDGPHSRRLEDIKGKPSRTIMVVEVCGTGIHWAEPRDLEFKTMSFHVNDPIGMGISSDHLGGAFVLAADGSVHFIEDQIDPKAVKAALTLVGGEDAAEIDKY